MALVFLLSLFSACLQAGALLPFNSAEHRRSTNISVMVGGPTGCWIPACVQGHLGVVLPAILDGLADESEGVRDAALQAGRTAVELFAQTSLPLLLPAVENGIIHDNWRIRQSSVELLGDLLFKVGMQ